MYVLLLHLWVGWGSASASGVVQVCSACLPFSWDMLLGMLLSCWESGAPRLARRAWKSSEGLGLESATDAAARASHLAKPKINMVGKCPPLTFEGEVCGYMPIYNPNYPRRIAFHTFSMLFYKDMFFTQQNHSTYVILLLNYVTNTTFRVIKILLRHMTAYNSILMSYYALFNFMEFMSPPPFSSASKINTAMIILSWYLNLCTYPWLF